VTVAVAVCLFGVALTGPCSEMCRRRNEGRKKLITKARYTKVGLAAAVRVYLYQIFLLSWRGTQQHSDMAVVVVVIIISVV
jgi:hypothetical protein